jgi:hypothetical protein
MDITVSTTAVRDEIIGMCGTYLLLLRLTRPVRNADARKIPMA